MAKNCGAKLLCCFNQQTALCIEITILVLSIIGIGLGIWGLAAIPWEYIHDSAKAFFIISFIVFIVQLIFTIILIQLRRKGTINNKTNTIGRVISVLFAVLSFCLFILILIFFFVSVHDLNDTDTKVLDTDLVSGGDWFNTVFTHIGTIIIWIILTLCWISDCLRIYAKNSGFLTVDNTSGVPQKTEVTVIDNRNMKNKNITGNNEQNNTQKDLNKKQVDNNNNRVKIGLENPIQYGNANDKENEGNNSGVNFGVSDNDKELNMIGNSNTQSQQLDKSNSIGNNNDNNNNSDMK